MADNGIWIIAGLGLVMGLVLLLPFFSKKAEEELEAFLFVMGVTAVSISGQWSWTLLEETFKGPIPIALAVLAAGFVFHHFQDRFQGWVRTLSKTLGTRMVLFILVTGLGLLSGLITSIIAALGLAETLIALRLRQGSKVRLAVLGCLSIGLGSALTPLGEPLSAITVAQLQGEPYHPDLFFLVRLLGVWVLPMLVLLGLVAAFQPLAKASPATRKKRPLPETRWNVAARSLRVYLFVMGLVLLGTGLMPIASRLLAGLAPGALFWMNMVSAALDNASLAAVEVNPAMTLTTLRHVLLGLLLSGIMLIPGNLPNIIAANKLGIKSGEWARWAFPLGLALMIVYFGLLTAWG